MIMPMPIFIPSVGGSGGGDPESLVIVIITLYFVGWVFALGLSIYSQIRNYCWNKTFDEPFEIEFDFDGWDFLTAFMFWLTLFIIAFIFIFEIVKGVIQ